MLPPRPPPARSKARIDAPGETTVADDSLARVLILATRPLCAVFAGRSLSAALADTERDLAPAQRAQVHELVYGVLRRHGWGDALLALLLSKSGLEAPLRALLLLALYRLDTRPELSHAIVDNAVDAAGVISQGKAGGLVNAVLRNFLRRRGELLHAIDADLAVQYRHPSWWIRRLRARYPGRWKEVCQADNELPPLTLRVNTRRTSRADFLAKLAAAGIDAVPVDGFPAAVRLLKSARVDGLPGFTSGDFVVQDAGAQRAAEWLALLPGQRVLDACAAPGGKTGHILQTAEVDLLSLDVDPRRCASIEETLVRLGLKATVRVGDAAQPASWWDGRPFDRILADVPCSASGVVRRHPDVKWLRRSSDIPAMARQQRAILDALWPLLAPGGKLLYVTCSVFSEENGEQIDAFLSAHADARFGQLGENAVPGLQLLPNAIHDGFFYSLLDKAA